MHIAPDNSNKPDYERWYNRPMPLSIRSNFYRFLGTIIKPFDKDLAALYKFRAKRADQKSSLHAGDKFMQQVFKDRWMGRSRSGDRSLG